MFKKRNIKNLVRDLLNTDIRTRSDDNYLIGLVQEIVVPGTSKMEFNQVLDLIRNGHLPAFESIRRSRQSNQKDYPELKDQKVLPFREAEKKEYIKLVRCAK